MFCLALHCHALRRPSHTKPCHATPCHTLLCLVLPCLLLTRSPNDHSVQRWHRKLHNRPRGPSAPSPPTLALETSKMHQNRTLGAQVPHQIQIWPWRRPKCFKIDPWKPKCPSPPNLGLETSKMLQNRSLEAQAAISSNPSGVLPKNTKIHTPFFDVGFV